MLKDEIKKIDKTTPKSTKQTLDPGHKIRKHDSQGLRCNLRFMIFEFLFYFILLKVFLCFWFVLIY
jgi:hypothetical protein